MTHEHIIFFSLSNRKKKRRKRERKREVFFFSLVLLQNFIWPRRRKREKIFHWMLDKTNYDWCKTKFYLLYLFVIRLNYNRVKDVWWVKEYKSNRFVYYPVVVVENHQRHSQHMEDWFLYNREFTFDQYLFRKKK